MPGTWPLNSVLADLGGGTRNVPLEQPVDVEADEHVLVWPAARLVGVYTADGELRAVGRLRA